MSAVFEAERVVSELWTNYQSYKRFCEFFERPAMSFEQWFKHSDEATV